MSGNVGGWREPLMTAPVYAAVVFNMALCFVNTSLFGVSGMHVVLSEVAIVSSAFLLASDRISRPAATALAALACYTCFIWLLSGNPDIKIARDMVIPFAFYFLGARLGDVRRADRVVWSLLIAVLAVGLFEWMFLDLFLGFFDVIGYYLARGTVDVGQTEYLATNLFVSGMRPEGQGRQLLSFLGEHRISSVFLEPVSAGNFAAVTFLWFLSRHDGDWKLTLARLAIPIALAILADARFAFWLCAILVLSQTIPLSRKSLVLLALPVAMILLVIAVASIAGGTAWGNNIMGRFSESGTVLASYGVLEWLGLKDTELETLDSGYAYLITNFGLLGAGFVWSVFILAPASTRRAQALKASIALYLALSLTISGSIFSIKTAALVWFLYGVAQRSKGEIGFVQSAADWETSDQVAAGAVAR